MRELLKQVLEDKLSVDKFVGNILNTDDELGVARELVKAIDNMDYTVDLDIIAEEFNCEVSDSDYEIHRCKYCGTYELWGGSDRGIYIWSCDECGDTFCSGCVDVGEENATLCNDCKEDLDEEDEEDLPQ